MGGYRLAKAYHMIISVYGYHLRHNYGTNLYGGVVDNVMWHIHW